MDKEEKQIFNDIQEALNPRSSLERLLIEELRQCGELVSDLPGDTVVEKVRGMKDQLRHLKHFCHKNRFHPDYEYTETTGPRKAFYDQDKPPDGDGWEVNTDAGRDGWERFDYHEEAYWRRLKQAARAAAERGEGDE